MSLESQPKAGASVLIVGGGVAGLSAALFLAWRGVRVVLVERHRESSPHPRAIGFTTRSLELFRSVGLAADIPQIPLGHGRPRRVAVESLAGKWSEEVPWTPPGRGGSDEAKPPSDGYSPCTGAAIAQDRLEPILRRRALALGVDLRMETTLVSFEQSHDAVTAVVRGPDGSDHALSADYMIAADGHRSRIREALGITRSGHGFMHVVRSVLFRADLDAYLASGISQFELDQPGLRGMLTTYRDGRWLLMVMDDEERDEATLRKMIVRALGRSDLDIEIITTGRWELSAFIADRFSSGRTFLVGDAAHTLPPARGGYGANTGIEDSFNLAWKLASVLSGAATEDLLDTYEAERKPIAWLRHNQIFARQDYQSVATAAEKEVALIEDDAMELGQLYRSKGVLGAASDLAPARRPEEWAGQPGTRAPHLWLSKGDEKISTLDLFHETWVLVTEDLRWCAAASEVTHQLGVEVRCVYFGDAQSGEHPPVSAPLEGVTSLTLDTPIQQIVADPKGRASLDAHAPEVAAHPAYETFKSMSLRALLPVSRGVLTDAKLGRIEADLATVACNTSAGDPFAFRNRCREAFGIGPAGASLIRPDGCVAWRTSTLPADPAQALAGAVSQVAYTRQLR